LLTWRALFIRPLAQAAAAASQMFDTLMGHDHDHDHNEDEDEDEGLGEEDDSDEDDDDDGDEEDEDSEDEGEDGLNPMAGAYTRPFFGST